MDGDTGGNVGRVRREILVRSGPTGVDLKNVTITGAADTATHTDSPFEDAPAIIPSERDPSTLENVCADRTGIDRDGVKCVDTDATITNTAIDASGEPIVVENGDVTARNVRFSRNCQTPRPRQWGGEFGLHRWPRRRRLQPVRGSGSTRDHRRGKHTDRRR